MLIYLMRHGQAQGLAPSDRARTLTDVGRQEVADVAQAMRSDETPAQLLYASPYTRARETAEIMGRRWLGSEQIEFHDCLVPGGEIERILARIEEARPESVLIVSHMPGISCLGGILIDGDPNSCPGFSTAGVMCIEMEMAAPGLGCLRWYKEPRDW